MTKVILLLTVFLIPLLPATSNFGYEQIKVLVFISLISLASVFWMGQGFKWTGISKVGISRILDRLENQGFIERKRRGMNNIVVLK